MTDPQRMGLAIACGAAVLAAGRAQAHTPPVRVSLPIREVVLSDQTRRYTVMLTVGSTQIEAGLDSGSTGLRILPGVLKNEDAKPGWRGDTYSYGSGAQYSGKVGRAHVSFAPGVEGEEDVQLIRSVGCAPGRAGCPADRIPLSAYGIQGDGLAGEGFKAILGLNLSETTLPNPLLGIGVKRWIIVLPRPGEGRPGALILNPTPDELAGYVSLPVAGTVGGGAHDGVMGCLCNDSSRETLCGVTVLDTGAPGIEVVGGGGRRAWPDGTPITLAFMKDGRQAAAFDMQVGRRDQGSHLAFGDRPLRTPGTRIFSGIAAYFAYEVAYDGDRQTLALKPRPPSSAAAAP